MAKVDFSHVLPFFNPAAYAGVDTKPKKAKKAVAEAAFESLLDSARESEAVAGVPNIPASEEAVQKLLDAVHDAGDALKNRPLPQEILRYKQAVRTFIHYIVGNGFDIERQVHGSKRSRRGERIDTIARVVDHKLEQLAAGILAGQTAQIGILHRLEEITGLLVDLML
ncbi:MAG: YaaR family protein [Treponema sp.]|jgi:uncharacterized protein YaaR (DUF327 family)|nr:YaaR family protein [Treponema sp.]